MRENKCFAIRSKVLKSNEPNKKYFLLCEGEKTEYIYFEAINNLRKRLKLNPLIEIIAIKRSFNEKGWSNPKKIIECLKKNLSEQNTKKFSNETILNNLMDYLISNDLISSKGLDEDIVYKTLKMTLEKRNIKLEDTASEYDICSIIEELKKLNIIGIIDKFDDIMKESNITYEEGFDTICIIVDRDKDSFTENQYEDVKSICKDKSFKLYVTNPCFEFWLLLHFSDAKELDNNKLKENPKMINKKRYVESELCKFFPKYKKSNYDGKEIATNVDTAIENEKSFCEDLEELKDNIGSNLGLLIQELRK